MSARSSWALSPELGSGMFAAADSPSAPNGAGAKLGGGCRGAWGQGRACPQLSPHGKAEPELAFQLQAAKLQPRPTCSGCPGRMDSRRGGSPSHGTQGPEAFLRWDNGHQPPHQVGKLRPPLQVPSGCNGRKGACDSTPGAKLCSLSFLPKYKRPVLDKGGRSGIN